MKMQAKGEFNIKLLPQADEKKIPLFARLLIDKEFMGELSGTSQGQMLSIGTAVANSAGYVAIERVEGTLNGKRGTFALQHNGTMDKGEPALSVTIVPDSGTDELLGITGKLTISIVDKKHFYDLEYELPE